MMIYSTYQVFAGTKNMTQIVTLLWSVKIPWMFAYQGTVYSPGVAQFAQWALAIYLVVYKNKTVFADEIDSAINPVLSDRVLSFINSHDHFGQFIYTTHNALALTLRTFMKEQIYFVSKDVETLQSSLYSLADFKDIRYDVKGEVYDFYLSGVLGGTLHG